MTNTQRAIQSRAREQYAIYLAAATRQMTPEERARLRVLARELRHLWIIRAELRAGDDGPGPEFGRCGDPAVPHPVNIRL